MKKWIFFIYIFIFLTLTGCGDQSFDLKFQEKLINENYQLLNLAGGSSGINHFKLPTTISEIPQDPNNPITKEKIKLGNMLFHDPIIAINNRDSNNRQTYSCSSCHSSQGGFSSGNFQGIAEGGFGFLNLRKPNNNSQFFDVQSIKVPPTLNIAYQKNLLWSGELGNTSLNMDTQPLWVEGTPSFFNELGYQGAETQALAGQMVHGLFDQSNPSGYYNSLSSEIFSSNEYIEMFKAAFPLKDFSDINNLINQETVSLAIAAYDRSIVANEAPFQKFLKGEKLALTLNQQRGLNLFLKKAQCIKCHSGPALNSMQFDALGFNNFSTNNSIIKEGSEVAFLGRGGFTKDTKDMYKFKVPQLYNLKDHFAHGHGNSFKNIKEVIEYKNKAIAQNKDVPQNQLSKDFIPLHLTDDEINALTDFIENGLYDNNLKRYVPSYVPSNIPFLN